MEDVDSGRDRPRGFALIELLILLMLIAGTVFVFFPKSPQATQEPAWADEAASLTRVFGTTNRIYFFDKNFYAVGPLNGCEPTGNCDCKAGRNPAASGACGQSCALLWCGYLAAQDFGQSRYLYSVADGSKSQPDPCGLSVSGAPNDFYVACAKRNLASGTAASWGYTVDVKGAVRAWPAVNGPPPSTP